MLVENYNPALDDLYVYDASNSGFPIGWNPLHPLYSVREQLRGIGIAKRQVSVNAESIHAAQGGIGEDLPPEMPPDTPLAQRPNYFTWVYPTMTFLAPRLAIGAMHFWDGFLQTRARPAGVGMWSLPTLRWMLADATIVANKANADFRGSWNQNPSGTYRAGLDVGLCEYQGANPFTGLAMPIVSLPTSEVPLSCWMIERQGRAVPIEVSPLGPDSPMDDGYRGVLSSARDLNLTKGDSGNVIVAVIDGVVYAVGHIRETNDEVGNVNGGLRGGMVQCWAAALLPDVAHLGTLGHTITIRTRPLVGAWATETTNQSILATLEGV